MYMYYITGIALKAFKLYNHYNCMRIVVQINKRVQFLLRDFEPSLPYKNRLVYSLRALHMALFASFMLATLEQVLGI